MTDMMHSSDSDAADTLREGCSGPDNGVQPPTGRSCTSITANWRTPLRSANCRIGAVRDRSLASASAHADCTVSRTRNLDKGLVHAFLAALNVGALLRHAH